MANKKTTKKEEVAEATINVQSIGLNEFAPEVKRLDASKRKAKVKQIRTAVAELEKELAQNVVTVDDPEFWNKIKLLKPNNDEFWSKIT